MCLFLFVLLMVITSAHAQWKPLRFAFLSDTHIGSPDGVAGVDLKRYVADINAMTDIAFVVITGDITELGTDKEITMAKKILDGLKVPYHVIPGNHDAGWSESGGVSFGRIFGNDKFRFDYNGITFIGCASGPYMRMSDGHIPRDAMNWLKEELRTAGTETPLIFLNHYPIDNSLDNWYEATDVLKQYNTLAILCGHGHSNHALNFEGIPAVMGRSNLRAKALVGGYNLITVRSDSMIFSERRPGMITLPAWTGIQLEWKWNNSSAIRNYSPAAFIPEIKDDVIYIVAPDRFLTAIDILTGKTLWRTNQATVSESIGISEDGHYVYGKTMNDTIVAFRTSCEKQQVAWKLNCGFGYEHVPSMLIEKAGFVYFGTKNGVVYAINPVTKKLVWAHKIDNAIVNTVNVLNGRQLIASTMDGTVSLLERK